MIEAEKDKLSISTPQSTLEQLLLSEDNVDELKNIIELFNLNIKKKDILRANKLSDVQDKISDQIATRIDKRANEFSNTDLLNYLKIVQDILDKSDNSLDSIRTPNIQINQQNNVKVDIGRDLELNKESRDKVVDAVQAILKKYKSSTTDVEIVEVNSTEMGE